VHEAVATLPPCICDYIATAPEPMKPAPGHQLNCTCSLHMAATCKDSTGHPPFCGCSAALPIKCIMNGHISCLPKHAHPCCYTQQQILVQGVGGTSW
jgi:hypothetical protein